MRWWRRKAKPVEWKWDPLPDDDEPYDGPPIYWQVDPQLPAGTTSETREHPA